MSVKWIVRMFVVALIVLIFIAAGGQAVLHLWNWLMPSLFGWHELTFWRAVDCWRCAASCSVALADGQCGARTSADAWASGGIR